MNLQSISEKYPLSFQKFLEFAYRQDHYSWNGKRNQLEVDERNYTTFQEGEMPATDYELHRLLLEFFRDKNLYVFAYPYWLAIGGKEYRCEIRGNAIVPIKKNCFIDYNDALESGIEKAFQILEERLKK